MDFSKRIEITVPATIVWSRRLMTLEELAFTKKSSKTQPSVY